MKTRSTLVLSLSLAISVLFPSMTLIAPDTFLEQQRKFERVRNAIQLKGELINQKLRLAKIPVAELNILIVAYKAEGQLIVYAKRNAEKVYHELERYDVCASSGRLGPKRKSGDMQVPEGFYHIERFNPMSNYHLSLGVNYPNASDRKLSKAKDLGGDIFIHGSCVTIGCLPMTDDKIREIYLYAMYAKNNGQQHIPVYIFPFKMTDVEFKERKVSYSNQQELISFWTNLKEGYELFEKKKVELAVGVDKAGSYTFE